MIVPISRQPVGKTEEKITNLKTRMAIFARLFFSENRAQKMKKTLVFYKTNLGGIHNLMRVPFGLE